MAFRLRVASIIALQPSKQFYRRIATMGERDPGLEKMGLKPSDQSANPNDGWKERPPYSIRSPNANARCLHEASCHCGTVKYQLSREIPLDSKLCHCTTCQTQHGQ
jgi:hypothetical protein